jgi:O-antigen/teichoic acid export membrane protein
VGKATASTGLGSLASGAVTAIALAVQSGLAAVVGVIIARELGRTAETDGFFAAYAVFIVLALAATAIRLVVLPPLARARLDRRLGQETAAWALALAVLAIPAFVAAAAAARPVAALLTGFGPDEARDAAEDVLPLMVLAAAAQLFAGLAASALAALDDYLTAAISYILGSAVGLAYILVRIDEDGIRAVAIGMALNGTIALGMSTLALVRRARREAMPRSAVRPSGAPVAERLLEAGRSASLPLALQAVYLTSLPFAAREGVGSVTSFGYAYLAGAALVAVTSSSLGLVTSVPLARTGLDAAGVARHVVASSWLALVAVGAAAGVFAVAGTSLVGPVLGDSYLADVGEQLGHLIALLGPWMVASIGFSVTLPLLFVQGRTRGLLLGSLAVVALHVPLAWLGQTVAGLAGLALALAVTTVATLSLMLARLHAAGPTLAALGRAASTVGLVAGVAFVAPALVVRPGLAAAAGLLAYAAVLVAVRPAGLSGSWHYLRTLA